MKIRTYSELMQISSFEDRYAYLRLGGEVGEITFGWERFLNQELYHSRKWKKVRDRVIIRDRGCDLAHPDFEIGPWNKIIIHHMNPLTPQQIEDDDDLVYDLNFLICTSPLTHNAIHYGDVSLIPKLPTKRYPGDTCLWK